MSEIVSFRADDEEVALMKCTRREHGFSTRAEAVRHLRKAGALARPRLRESRLARFRLPEAVRTGRTWTSEELDAVLYDGPRRERE